MSLHNTKRKTFGLKKKLHSCLRQSHEYGGNGQMQRVFTTEEILEVTIESWSEWN